MWTVFKRHQAVFEALWRLKGPDCSRRFVVHMSDWLSKSPARMMGILGTKGSLAVGKFADFVVWDAEESLLCNEETIYTYNPEGCLYQNAVVECEVKSTYLRGVEVFGNGKLTEKRGRVLLAGSPELLLLPT